MNPTPYPASSILQGDYLERAPREHVRRILHDARYLARTGDNAYVRACWRQVRQRAAAALNPTGGTTT